MMKRTLICLFAVLGIATAEAQQRFEPNTKWPYLYWDFQPGTIYFDDNKKSEADLNIHLAGNVLHYVDAEGRIRESQQKGIIRVEIGKDAYLYNGSRLMQVVDAKGTSVLLRLTRGDFDAMQSGGGAYGASLNSSAAKDLSSLDLGGLNNPEMGKMLQEKNDGSTIPLVDDYYFIIDGQQVKADKKSLDKLLANRAADWKKFQKEHKVKWKKVESLQEVLQFIAQ